MIYVGIDIAKEKHFASFIDSTGEILEPPFPVFNSSEGFSFLLSKLQKYDQDNILIGLESTGHYAENLIFYLDNLNYKIGIINPIQTNALRKINIRKTKNDKIDTFLISECLMSNHYSLFYKKDVNLLKLRVLTRHRLKTITLLGQAKVNITTCLDQLFPELPKVITKHSSTMYEVLKKYPSPAQLSKAHLDSLTKLITKASHGRFKESTAIKLKELTKSTIGVPNNCLTFELIQYINQVEFFTNQIKEIDKEITELMKLINSKILTIPGIGIVLGSTIISEIGNINRFDSAKKLLAYAGLDPSVIQSGNFNATNTKISKRGSSYLRYAIQQAAGLIIWNDDTFKAYYELKRSQNKSYLCALGHVSNKLVRVIYKILKDNIEYQKQELT